MNDEHKGTDMVPHQTDAEQQNASRFMQQFPDSRTSVGQLTAMPNGTPAEKAALWQLANSEGELIATAVNVEIGIVNWMVVPIQVEKEGTGELRTIPMLKLLCDNSKIYRTTGEKLIRSLLGYNYSVRPAPWSPPLRFKVVRKPGRGSNSFYDLEAFSDSVTGLGDDPAPATLQGKPAPKR